MPATEFEIIASYFNRPVLPGRGVVLGTGDDAAIVEVPAGYRLAVSTDTLAGGVHFLPDDPPADIGYKSLAANLSDMAAMGAEPRWVTLSLTLPGIDEDWIGAFAGGFYALAERHGVSLIGGDMSRGPLSITVQILGTLADEHALRRSGARLGDAVYVTGSLGMASLALAILKNQAPGRREPPAACLERLRRPAPRVSTGLLLQSIASAAIDVSDGLAADLGHILASSAAGADITLGDIPVCPELGGLGEDDRWRHALGGGDDYELCFTVAPNRVHDLQQRLQGHDIPVTRIGTITAGNGINWLGKDGKSRGLDPAGYRHF